MLSRLVPCANFLVLTLCLLIGCSAQHSDSTNSKSFYVSPKGDDNNDGLSQATPYLTLEKASDAARSAASTLPETGVIEVILQDGVFQRSQPLVLGTKDSGPKLGKIIYRAAKNARPVIDGSVLVKEWSKLDSASPAVAALPAAARGKVWVASFPNEATKFHNLFADGRMQPRARSQGWAHHLPFDSKEALKSAFTFPPGKLKNWPNVEDIEIRTVGSFQWASNLIPLSKVDEPSRTAKLAVNATYPIRQIKWAKKDRIGLWTENHLEALDEPGEWVANSKTRKIYFWPPDEKSPEGRVRVPVVRQLLRVEGDQENDRTVRNLEFRGITFRHVDRTPIQPDDRALQHDWDFYDKPDSIIRLRYADNIKFAECLITESGASGIRLDLKCQDITITNSELSSLGGSGIIIVGYGPGGPDVNARHVVTNNFINDIGKDRWSSSGILLSQTSDTRIAHNRIAFTPYNAITLTGVFPHIISKRFSETREMVTTLDLNAMGMNLDGNEHTYTWKDLGPFLYIRNTLIEKNRIYRAKEILGDGNAIYVRGASQPNTIRQNLIHHCIGHHMRGIIRNDDHQFGTLVEDNIIYACVSTGIIGKGANTTRNNFIVHMLEENDPLNPYQEPLQGYIRLVSAKPSLYHGAPGLEGDVTENNVLLHKGNKRPIFLQDHPNWPRASDFTKATVRGNVMWWAGHPQQSEQLAKGYRDKGIDPGALAINPEFTDPATFNFSFPPDGPLKGKIKPLDPSTWDIDLSSYPKWLAERLPGPEAWKDNFPEPKKKPDTATGAFQLTFSKLQMGPLAKQIPWINAQGEPDSIRIIEANGKKILQLQDSPDQKHPWMPLLGIDRLFDDNNILSTTWRLRFDQPADFALFMRENAKDAATPGPYLNFRTDGKLTARGNRELGGYPIAQWFDLSVETKLGGDGTYTVRLHDGESETVYEHLKSLDRDLKRVEMMGLMGTGQSKGSVQVEAIEAKTIEVN